MDFRQNYFELFGLPLSFAVDQVVLQQRYQELQKSLHPDRHAAASSQQQRMALQYATYVNEGLATLKSPLKRSGYLLQLAGLDVRSEANTTKDVNFLMQQMEWREALQEASAATDPFAVLNGVRDEVGQARDGLYQRFVSAWQQGDADSLAQAHEYHRQLQFMHKLHDEVDAMEERLDD